MNSTQTRYVAGGVIVVILLAIAAYVFWQGAHKPGFQPSATTATTSATTTTQISSTTVVVSGPSGTYTITQLPDSTTPPAPPYKAAIICPSTMSQDQCASIQTKDASIIATLNKNQTDSGSWITLGTLRKEVGDYTGAATAWKYVTELYPTSPIAFLDLGDLYMNFAHDYPKAEANLLAAIKVQASNPAAYEDLFSLYTTTSYKPSSTAAEDILKKGVANNPKAINLQIDLARYYEKLGRINDANVEYDAAIQNAQSQGETQLAQQLQAEKAGR